MAVANVFIRIRADASRLRRELGGAASETRRITAGTRRLAGGLRTSTRHAERLRGSLRGIKLLLTGAAAYGAYRLARGFIDAAASVEQIRIRLLAMTGSAEKAGAAFRTIDEFAKRTPFTLQEIAQASPALLQIARDMDEFRQVLSITSDIAASTGLTFQETAMQLVRAFSAGIGAADLFREKGVNALLGFQAGAEYTAEETRKHIMDMFRTGQTTMRGISDVFARSWGGTLSMLQDKWFRFKNNVMGAMFPFLRDLIGRINAWIDQNYGSIEQFGRVVGQKLVEYIKAFAIGALDAVLLVSQGFSLLVQGADRLDRAIARMIEHIRDGIRDLKRSFDEFLQGGLVTTVQALGAAAAGQFGQAAAIIAAYRARQQQALQQLLQQTMPAHAPTAEMGVAPVDTSSIDEFQEKVRRLQDLIRSLGEGGAVSFELIGQSAKKAGDSFRLAFRGPDSPAGVFDPARLAKSLRSVSSVKKETKNLADGLKQASNWAHDLRFALEDLASGNIVQGIGQLVGILGELVGRPVVGAVGALMTAVGGFIDRLLGRAKREAEETAREVAETINLIILNSTRLGLTQFRFDRTFLFEARDEIIRSFDQAVAQGVRGGILAGIKGESDWEARLRESIYNAIADAIASALIYSDAVQRALANPLSDIVNAIVSGSMDQLPALMQRLKGSMTFLFEGIPGQMGGLRSVIEQIASLFDGLFSSAQRATSAMVDLGGEVRNAVPGLNAALMRYQAMQAAAAPPLPEFPQEAAPFAETMPLELGAAWKPSFPERMDRALGKTAETIQEMADEFRERIIEIIRTGEEITRQEFRQALLVLVASIEDNIQRLADALVGGWEEGLPSLWEQVTAYMQGLADSIGSRVTNWVLMLQEGMDPTSFIDRIRFAMRTIAERLQSLGDELRQGPIESIKAALGALATSVRFVSSLFLPMSVTLLQLQNASSQAAQAVSSLAGAVSQAVQAIESRAARVQLPVLGSSDMEEWQRRMGYDQPNIQIQFNAPVYGQRDFEQVVQQSVDVAERERNVRTNGSWLKPAGKYAK